MKLWVMWQTGGLIFQIVVSSVIKTLLNHRFRTLPNGCQVGNVALAQFSTKGKKGQGNELKVLEGKRNTNNGDSQN